MIDDIREIFWSLVKIVDEKDCWLWQGKIMSHGYGRIDINKKSVLAHRVSWILTYGDIPIDNSYHGICVLHKCDNRLCVNPNHLFLGTQNDNMKDVAKKKRGNANAQKKLSEEKVKEIRQKLINKETTRQIAKEFGVSHNAIWLIKKGISWKE